jgi:hypothetical protein
VTEHASELAGTLPLAGGGRRASRAGEACAPRHPGPPEGVLNGRIPASPRCEFRQPQAGGQPGPEEITIRLEHSCDVAARGRIDQIPSAVRPELEHPEPRIHDTCRGAGLVVFSAGRSRWRRGSSSADRADGISRISMRRDSSDSAGDARRSPRSRTARSTTSRRPSPSRRQQRRAQRGK